MIRTLSKLSFCLVFFLALAVSLSAQSGVQYVYDQLGRLVGVIDTSGNAAAYSYDPVGNLLAINRYTAGQTSVLGFTPTSGPVGTTVTITGTGYSATPSQDTVAFNGTSASVTSATVNQIVATVPAGATNGPIQVTTPSGTFTTATNFTVTTGTGAPTITSFTPGTATAGAAITITGTNFDPTPVNDKLVFNTTQEFVHTVTTTTISATVPAATSSGHISVSTPGGIGTSTQDLYVPFGTHVAGDVGYTSRTTLGGTATISIGTASKVGLLLFDAAAGQRVSLSLSGGTFSACTPHVIAPNASELLAGTQYCTSGTTFIDTIPLAYTGTYSFGVDPGSSIGSLTVKLNNVPPDVTGTITLGGSPVSVTTTVPGQNASLTFSGTSGQKASISLTNGTFSYGGCSLTLKNPDGSALTNGACYNSSNFIDTSTLTQTGTYTIFMDPQGAATGSVTVQLNNDSDVTGTITPSGSAVTVTTTAAGQDGRLTFSGTANQRVSLAVTNVTNPNAYVYLLKPDGTTQSYIAIQTSCGCFLDTQTLATTGTYTVWVRHIGTNVGSATLQMYNVPADPTGTISIGGSAVGVATTVPGQNASLTFSGTAGQKVSESLTAGTYGSCNLTLKNPDGTSLKSGSCSGATNFVDTATLVQTGTHTIFVDPQGTATGGVTVKLNNDSDLTGTITPGGSAVTVTTTIAGQDERLTFNGTANQRVSLTVTSVTNPSAYVYLLKPDGTTQTYISISTSCGCFMDVQTLTTTGTYTLWVQHYGTYTGSETLQLYNVPADVTGSVTVNGSSLPVAIGTPGQNASITFGGTSGQGVTLRVTVNTINPVTVQLLNPSGTSIASAFFSSSTYTFASQTLSTTGTYTIFINPSSSAAGSMTVNVTSP